MVQKISELLAKSKLNYMYVFALHFLIDIKYRYNNTYYNPFIELEITYIYQIPRAVTSAIAKKWNLQNNGNHNRHWWYFSRLHWLPKLHWSKKLKRSNGSFILRNMEEELQCIGLRKLRNSLFKEYHNPSEGKFGSPFLVIYEWYSMIYNNIFNINSIEF